MEVRQRRPRTGSNPVDSGPERHELGEKAQLCAGLEHVQLGQRDSSGGSSRVAVVKPTEDRQLDHPPQLRRLHRTRLRRVLAEGQVRAARVVVLSNESPEQPSKVTLVQNDGVVE